MIITGVSGGKLFLSAVEITTFPTTVAVADLAGNLTFEPTPDLNNTIANGSVTFQVVDDSGNANDTDLTPNTLTIDINPINDAPVVPDSPDDRDRRADGRHHQCLAHGQRRRPRRAQRRRRRLCGCVFGIGQAVPDANDTFGFDTTGACSRSTAPTSRPEGWSSRASRLAVRQPRRHLQQLGHDGDHRFGQRRDSARPVYQRVKRSAGLGHLVYLIDDGAPDAVQGQLGSPGNNLDGGTVTVNITAINDEPTLTATAVNPTFTEGDTAPTCSAPSPPRPSKPARRSFR